MSLVDREFGCGGGVDDGGLLDDGVLPAHLGGLASAVKTHVETLMDHAAI